MNSSKKLVCVSLNVGDQLTTISCGHVVVEFIKFIAYQRFQIPYSYQWLKQIVNQKKSREDTNVKESFQSERHFRVASTALRNLDFILKSLLLEINTTTLPDEVCVALGATPVTCKEVYRILLPSLCHKPQCHSALIANDDKIQKNVFKALVTSEDLRTVFFSRLPPTNTYVFIKKKLVSNQDSIIDNENFVYTSGCMIPRNSNIIVIDLRTNNLENVTCCNDFQIFGDIVKENLENLQVEEKDEDYNEFNEIESTDTAKWYQSSYVMKGFSDCVVNGTSVTNSWVSQ